MLYSIIQNVVGGTDNDLSDYVTKIGAVPYVSKNRDFSLLAEGYNFGLSYNCPFTVATGDRILFYRNTQVVHIGIIESTNLDEDNLIYNVEVRHILTELQKRNMSNTRTPAGVGLGYKQFIEILLENSSEITIGTLDYDLILVKDIVDIIINETEEEALSLDWTNASLYTADTFTWKSVEGGDTTGTIVDAPESDISDVYMLPQQVICIGQNGIFTQEEFTNDMYADMPTLFDLLSIFCSVFGLYFIPKDATTFYVVSKKAVATGNFTDDKIYNIETEDEIIDTTGARCTYSTLDYKLWFATSVDLYDNGTMYYNGDYVSYNGNIYRATFGYYNATEPETGGIVGIPPTDPDYWYQVTLDVELIYYIDPVDNTKWFVNYEYLTGVKPTYLDWYDNLNFIVMDGTTAYITVPAVDTDDSVLYYQRRAKLYSYKRINLITKASSVISATQKDYDSVAVIDINTDTVEVEYFE